MTVSVPLDAPEHIDVPLRETGVDVANDPELAPVETDDPENGSRT